MSLNAQWCLGEMVLSVKQLCLRVGFIQNLICGLSYYTTVQPWFSVSLPTFDGTTYVPGTNTYSSYFTMVFAYARGGTSVAVRMFRPDYWTDVAFSPGTAGDTGDFLQELGSFSYRSPYYWVTSRFRIGNSPPASCVSQLASHAPADLYAPTYPTGRVFTSMTDDGQLGYFLSCPPLTRVLPVQSGPLSGPAYPQPSTGVFASKPLPVSLDGDPVEVIITPESLPVSVSIDRVTAEVPVYSPVGSTLYNTPLGTTDVNVVNDHLDVSVIGSVPVDVFVENSVDVNLASTVPGFFVQVANVPSSPFVTFIVADPTLSGPPFPVELFARDRITHDLQPVAATNDDSAPPAMLAWSSA